MRQTESIKTNRVRNTLLRYNTSAILCSLKGKTVTMADVRIAVDEVDFHSKFTLYDEQNKQLLEIGLSQKKMMILFLCFLAVIFIVLVAFNAIETKDIRELRDFFDQY